MWLVGGRRNESFRLGARPTLPSSSGTKFAGSIPALYDAHFVPMLFEPYAADLVDRVRALRASRILEIAPGGGFVFNVWDKMADSEFCQGTPLRNEIEARDASRLGEATGTVEAALARRFGPSAIEGRMRAYVVVATAPRT